LETGLLRFGTGATAGGFAGVSGTSVDRFAASALAGEVSVGCEGGGWRRSAIGLCDAQPEEFTQRTQRAQSAQRGKHALGEEFLREPDCRLETPLRESELTETVSVEFFKGPPGS
jgi:hypothetical protein